jgi:heme-degrading monooxygenase HmoA
MAVSDEERSAARSTVARLWKTGIDPTRHGEFRDFEQRYSLPMFREQRGFLGVLFLHSAAGAAVLTLWASREDAERLAESSAYRATVARLEQTGLLRGEQTIEVFEMTGAHIARSLTAVGCA